MQQKRRAIVIGRAYIDFTVIPNGRMPTGDEKDVAKAKAVSFGGNAVTAAFCCAKLGITPELITTDCDDWLGRMFREMAAHYQVPLHPRAVPETAYSLVMPNDGKRAILRCRPETYDDDFPRVDVDGAEILHLDGHQEDAALYYAKLCRERGILTSLDGGSLRENTDELLGSIDVAVVSERLCEQMGKRPMRMLDYLRKKGCRVGAVTLGSRGLLWYESRFEYMRMSPFPVPQEKVVDTNGAGDVFHGAYMFSYLRNPHAAWRYHFRFASAASAHSIQHLGIEAGLPELATVDAIIAQADAMHSGRPQLAVAN